MAKAKKIKPAPATVAPKKVAQKAAKKAVKKANTPRGNTAAIPAEITLEAIENIALAQPEALPTTAANAPAVVLSISANRYLLQEIDGFFCCMEKQGNRFIEHAAFLDQNACIAHIIDQHAGDRALDLRVTVGSFELKKEEGFYCCTFNDGGNPVEHLCFISPKACIDHMLEMHT